VTGVILVLLASFGVVVVGAVGMVTLHRRLLRQWRRQNRMVDPLSQVTAARRRAVGVPLPGRWLAIRSSNTHHIRESLALRGSGVSWSEALSRARERCVFVSQPVDGWTLVVGGGLPDATMDADRLYRFLMELSLEVGEVQYFSLDRVLGFHGWARIKDGRVMRAYAWAGQAVWNEGRMTLDERLLGLRCHEYGADQPELEYGQTSPEFTNVERVPLLARRWGLDLASATELLLHQEAVESDESGAAG
jgi:hypothetical protein